MAEGQEDIVTIEWNEKTDLIASECSCPICGDKFLYGVPYVMVPCKVCGNTHRSDFKQDIYTKKSRQVNSILAYHNGVKIKASENYESPLTLLRHHYTYQNCWEVSSITKHYEEYKRCERCGVCRDCLTCKSCGSSFKSDKNKRKQICPKCKSGKFVKSYFTEVLTSEKNKDIKLCPFCRSDNIRMSRTKNQVKCHLCGSKELSRKRSNIIFELVIMRKKGYYKEKFPRE
jgi:hypothetical protein